MGSERLQRLVWVGAWIVMTMPFASCAKRPTLAEPSPNMTAIKARFGHEVLHWIIERKIGGEEIACGYVGLADRPFIARSGQVFMEEDLPPGQLDHWEDRLCGPDWVKPLPMPPGPS